MKKWVLICYLVVLGAALLDGCSTLRNTIIGWGPTPGVEDYGEYPAVTEPFTYYNMNCSVITRTSKGFTWNGITIGKTTYSEIIESWNPSKVAWSRQGNVYFLDANSDYLFETCFIGETISALELRPPHLITDQRFETIFDYVEVFGPPDLITWGEIDNRTVLWADEGFVASALTRDDAPYGEIWGLVIISPFSPLSKNQWLTDAIETDPPRACVFDSTLEGYSYDGYQSCCLDPFFGTDEDECGIIEGYAPDPNAID